MHGSVPSRSSIARKTTASTPMRGARNCIMSGPDDGPGPAAGHDGAEQALCFLVAEHVDHEAPEHRHHEHVEDGQPDEERRREPARIRHHLEQDVEHEEIGSEECVRDRQQQRLAHPRHERPEQRRQQQHDRERADVERKQALDGTARHGIAQRAQQVVGAEQHEEIGERETDRALLARVARAGVSGSARVLPDHPWRAEPARCGRPLPESFSTKTRRPSLAQ